VDSLFCFAHLLGTQLLYVSLVSDHHLRGHSADAFLHGRPVGVHDRHPGAAAWLVLAFESGLLGAAFRQLSRLTAQAVTNQVSLVAAITALLSLLMIVFCAYRWKRHYSGLGKSLSTFLITLVIVVVYYGILVVWFWNTFPKVTT
jgi:hypothetical protein